MARVLVTGGHGFIGSHLMNYLYEKGNKVLGIDNLMHASQNEVHTKYVDVRNYKELLDYFSNCDVCFHLAAQISVDRSIQFPQETIDINILGTQNVLECARKTGTKVVFASTSEIYGTSQKEFIDENHPLDCHSPYGASKVAADRLCLAYKNTFGSDVVIVRNFNTFGTYQSDDSYGGVIAKFTNQALKGEDLILYGDGSQERDYMHISDAMKAYEIAMCLPSGTVVNFGTGKTIVIKELAEQIIKLTGSQSRIIVGPPRKGEVQRLCADITKAKTYGFAPQTNFDEHLKEYIEWKTKR